MQNLTKMIWLQLSYCNPYSWNDGGFARQTKHKRVRIITGIQVEEQRSWEVTSEIKHEEHPRDSH